MTTNTTTTRSLVATQAQRIADELAIPEGNPLDIVPVFLSCVASETGVPRKHFSLMVRAQDGSDSEPMVSIWCSFLTEKGRSDADLTIRAAGTDLQAEAWVTMNDGLLGGDPSIGGNTPDFVVDSFISQVKKLAQK